MEILNYSSEKLNSVRSLLDQAMAVRENAYAPFSKFKVGAALLTAKNNIYKGCNVENASIGGTICAERGAAMAAIATEGANSFLAIAIASGSDVPAAPCGICRQFLSQFMAKDAKVYLISTITKDVTVLNFWDLIPYPFTEF